MREAITALAAETRCLSSMLPSLIRPGYGTPECFQHSVEHSFDFSGYKVFGAIDLNQRKQSMLVSSQEWHCCTRFSRQRQRWIAAHSLCSH